MREGERDMRGREEQIEEDKILQGDLLQMFASMAPRGMLASEAGVARLGPQLNN